MAKFPFDIVGFDLDGTLLDTHRDLAAAVNHALALGGFDLVPVDHARDLIGGGAKAMLAKAVKEQGGLPDEEFRKLYKQMLTFYGQNCAVHSAPYPHVAETLADLNERGVKTALITNKFESFARDVLTQLRMIDCFDTLLGGDTLGKGRSKPAPDPLIEARERLGSGRMVYIGDSSYDVMAAKSAGIPVVVAAYGYCDRAANELGGDAVIDSMAQFIPLLESW